MRLDPAGLMFWGGVVSLSWYLWGFPGLGVALVVVGLINAGLGKR